MLSQSTNNSIIIIADCRNIVFPNKIAKTIFFCDCYQNIAKQPQNRIYIQKHKHKTSKVQAMFYNSCKYLYGTT